MDQADLGSNPAPAVAWLDKVTSPPRASISSPVNWAHTQCPLHCLVCVCVCLFVDPLTFCVRPSWHDVASDGHYQVGGGRENRGKAGTYPNDNRQGRQWSPPPLGPVTSSHQPPASHQISRVLACLPGLQPWPPCLPTWWRGQEAKVVKSGGTKWREGEAGMFTAALLMTDKTRKQPKCPPADGQTAKMWCIQVMATKRNEARIQATTWMNLEHAMLSERSQAQKTT